MCGIGNGIDSYQWGGTTTLRTKKKTAFCVSCKLLHLFYCAVEHLNMGGFGGLTHFWVQPWVASRTAVFCCWWVFFLALPRWLHFFQRVQRWIISLWEESVIFSGFFWKCVHSCSWAFPPILLCWKRSVQWSHLWWVCGQKLNAL